MYACPNSYVQLMRHLVASPALTPLAHPNPWRTEKTDPSPSCPTRWLSSLSYYVYM